MLDRDLAELYGVPTKALIQAVKHRLGSAARPENFFARDHLAPRGGIWYNTHRTRQRAHIPPPRHCRGGARPGQPGLSISMVTMKVNLYIDGFNLYYGMLKGTPLHW